MTGLEKMVEFLESDDKVLVEHDAYELWHHIVSKARALLTEEQSLAVKDVGETGYVHLCPSCEADCVCDTKRKNCPSFVTSMIMVLLGGITATTCFINYPPEGKGDGKKQDKGDDE